MWVGDRFAAPPPRFLTFALSPAKRERGGWGEVATLKSPCGRGVPVEAPVPHLSPSSKKAVYASLTRNASPLPFAEYGAADTHQCGALFNGDLEVVGHPH